MRVALVGHRGHALCEPFAGGLESMTFHLVQGLRARGIEVTVLAGSGIDPTLGAAEVPLQDLAISAAAQADSSMPSEVFLADHYFYLQSMLWLARETGVSVVHNNSLHYLPIALSESLRCATLTTLHTPPTPWIETAIGLATDPRQAFAAVSRHTSQAWEHACSSSVVYNGVDTQQWRMGPGGPDLVWSGRVVPEKAPHLAIDIAAAAGRRIRLAGPLSDLAYYEREIVPRLGDSAVYVGHLSQARLTDLVGASAVALVTPQWDEPYGLVAAEALSCGTPVLAFDRGGLTEVIDPTCGVLAPAQDIAAAVDALPFAEALDRRAARHRAERHCSLEVMVSSYVDLYEELAVA
ncbi:glycosyltransferase [Luteipulveratus sp. YIM 133132]|uniref:Glycosyltransferase n=1 Tax=Luteipulveratus flavus TaxID=3031728 RepID=A0ABT6C6S3_9MICO|nr:MULTISPECIES: glycosyltransferase [unclassified Luteipulveratus]MDE9366458.1 glycosyltransferase [Luteipulveratus sp. YIM 133132]MDF8264268.1 glycosyltransferase [Luteipulveratus sp. YIM 133296]